MCTGDTERASRERKRKKERERKIERESDRDIERGGESVKDGERYQKMIR